MNSCESSNRYERIIAPIVFQNPPGRPTRVGLRARILLKLREGPLPSVRAVAESVGAKPTNTATTWRVLRRLLQDGLVVRVPGLGWVRRDDEATLLAWSEGLPDHVLRWLEEAGPPFRFDKNGSPRYWNPDLDEVQMKIWRASGKFPRAEETPLAFAAMKQAASTLETDKTQQRALAVVVAVLEAVLDEETLEQVVDAVPEGEASTLDAFLEESEDVLEEDDYVDLLEKLSELDLLKGPSVLPAHLNPREDALRYGDYDLRRELLRRHARFPARAWDWHPPDEPAPTGTPRWVVWEGPEGTGEDAEVFIPHGPAFRRGVPVQLPEPMAKRLVETAEEKAGEVEDPLPPHFRYATKDEAAAAGKEEAGGP